MLLAALIRTIAIVLWAVVMVYGVASAAEASPRTAASRVRARR